METDGLLDRRRWKGLKDDNERDRLCLDFDSGDVGLAGVVARMGVPGRGGSGMLISV
jgi:hypothetical protein